MVTSLSDFSDIIRKLGEETQRERDAYLRKMREELPAAIQGLIDQRVDWLLDALEQFSCPVYDIRENELRTEFRQAVRLEIMKRIVGKI